MGFIEISNPNFRPETQTVRQNWVFDMRMPGQRSAALGDMVAWMSAIVYVAENYNYVAGHLIVPKYFLELASNLIKPFEHWRVYTDVPDRLAEGCSLKQPMEHPLNATGMHLVDLGYVYFAGLNPIPDGAGLYPALDLSNVKPPRQIDGPYVVMTPGATAANRTMPAEVFNAVADHLLEKGVTPVYLGVHSMDKGKREIGIDKEYDLSQGLNLIGATTLLQAAKVMSGAKIVLGIDNGLLHLAGLTETPIIFGYTMTGPKQRRIYRKVGQAIELYADKDRVPCLFCQEHVRFFKDHHFTNCIYKEQVPLCVKALNKESWIAAIDVLLKENP